MSFEGEWLSEKTITALNAKAKAITDQVRGKMAGHDQKKQNQ